MERYFLGDSFTDTIDSTFPLANSFLCFFILHAIMPQSPFYLRFRNIYKC